MTSLFPDVSVGPGIAVRQLRVARVRDGQAVVDDVAFTVDRGNILGLVGESGSGKTTVALALLGFARPGLRIESGVVVVDGADLLGLDATAIRRRRGSAVSYVAQDPASALNPALKVGTQLREMFIGRAEGADVENRLVELLEEVTLPAGRILKSYPHELSGGQQQRVVLAMAFALRPAVVVLDEPTTGLDVTTQRHILDTIRDLCATRGTTGIFVSHDLAIMSALVDHIAVMYAGRIIESGAKSVIFEQAAHPYTRALLRAAPNPNRPAALIGLPGHPPRPGEREAGCSFAARCDFAAPACLAARPPLVSMPDVSHMVRCVRTDEVLRSHQPNATRSRVSSQRTNSTSVLEVVDVSAGYGASPVVRAVSLGVDDRECVAIVGESGSGKTTLARCIVGLHGSFSGEVLLRGVGLPHGVRRRSLDQLRMLQYIFQNPHASLNPRKTIHEILAQPTQRVFDVEAAETTRRIVGALEAAALPSEVRYRFPGELSGGECQRVAIALSLIHI